MNSQQMKRVIWITGLSGAGKTTLAKKLAPELRRLGSQVILLDGDELRTIFNHEGNKTFGHSRKDRIEIAYLYGRLCRVLVQQGMTVIIATISMFREVHEWNRAHLPGYFEVYLKVPLEELHRRDPKGIYAGFRKGSIQNVAGLDLPVDEPENPDLKIEWENELSEDLAIEILMERLICH